MSVPRAGSNCAAVPDWVKLVGVSANVTLRDRVVGATWTVRSDENWYAPDASVVVEPTTTPDAFRSSIVAVGDRGLAAVEPAVAVGVVIDEPADHIAREQLPPLERLDAEPARGGVRTPAPIPSAILGLMAHASPLS